MKKIITLSLIIVFMVSFAASAMISVPEDTGPIYRPKSPRVDTRDTMNEVFDHPDGSGHAIADVIGDTMEANYSWGEFFVDGDENRRVVIVLEMISFDHYILLAYYNFMEEFFDEGYSHASPIVREDMAATLFTRYLSDQSELTAADNVIFAVRTFLPDDATGPKHLEKDKSNIEIKMDLGDGKFSSKGSTHRQKMVPTI